MTHVDAPSVRGRAGITLLEMMVAISLLLVVSAVAVPFFRVQSRSVSKHAGREDAHHNARFATTVVERELRVAGVGVVDKQPLVVQAAVNAVTFNADLVTRDASDPQAVYFDDSADSLAVTALPRSRRITLPLSGGVSYPDSTYFASAGLPSKAETISYWIAPDTAPERAGQSVLYRRVNDTPASIVARGIKLQSGQRLFRYYKTDSLGRPVEIPVGQLPLYHSAAIHGSKADTGRSALSDSVRIVRLHVDAVFTDPDKGQVLRTVEAGVRLLNSGLVRYSTCGEPPLGAALFASAQAGPQVVLTWNSSGDDGVGEKDVERYALYRRPQGTADWGEPFASVSAGLVNYSYVDQAVVAGESWEYGLVAQDCTPLSSGLSASAAVLIP